MSRISTVELRRNARSILERVRRGERIVLTYRGKAIARLEPFDDAAVREDDPFYSIGQKAVEGANSLTNAEIDAVLYVS